MIYSIPYFNLMFFYVTRCEELFILMISFCKSCLICYSITPCLTQHQLSFFTNCYLLSLFYVVQQSYKEMGIAIAATSSSHRKKEKKNSFHSMYNTKIESTHTRGSENEVEMTTDDSSGKGLSTSGTDRQKVVIEAERDRERTTRVKQEKVKEESKKDKDVDGNKLDKSGNGGGSIGGGVSSGGVEGGVEEGKHVKAENKEEEEEEEEEEEDLSDEAVEARHEGMLKSMRDRWATLQKLRMEKKYALLGIPFNWDEGACVWGGGGEREDAYVCVRMCECVCVCECLCLCVCTFMYRTECESHSSRACTCKHGHMCVCLHIRHLYLLLYLPLRL